LKINIFKDNFKISLYTLNANLFQIYCYKLYKKDTYFENIINYNNIQWDFILIYIFHNFILSYILDL